MQAIDFSVQNKNKQLSLRGKLFFCALKKLFSHFLTQKWNFFLDFFEK
jgi:hypothetical protein